VNQTITLDEGANMLIYPVTLTPDSNGTFLVGFPDFPEANSVGDDEDEALLNAVDALETALEMYFDDRRPVPMPSKIRKGQTAVALPALEAAKILIWNEMHAQKLRKAELARRLNVHMPQIDRLFDLRHSSKLEFVEQAAKALGKTLSVSLA
jgi:antitoxin HicB